MRLFKVVSGLSNLCLFRRVSTSCLVLFCLCRTLRQVKHRSEDKRLDDDQVLASLLRLFTELFRNDASNQTEQLRLLPASSRRGYYITHNAAVDRPEVAPREMIMLHTLGFCVEKMASSLPDAGTGVFVTRGQVPKGVPVAMYPGTFNTVKSYIKCKKKLNLTFL